MATVTCGTKAPIAQHTPLGWAVVGSLCPWGVNSAHATSFKTSMCGHEHLGADLEFASASPSFQRCGDDELLGTSANDRKFLAQVVPNLHRDSQGYIEASLPFKCENQLMPNNRQAVYCRQ
jgi:hypothetical protein